MPVNDLAAILGLIGLLLGLLAALGFGNKQEGAYRVVVTWKNLTTFALSIACLGFSFGLDDSVFFGVALLVFFLCALAYANRFFQDQRKKPH